MLRADDVGARTVATSPPARREGFVPQTRDIVCRDFLPADSMSLEEASWEI
jgi:hypothetical protein